MLSTLRLLLKTTWVAGASKITTGNGLCCALTGLRYKSDKSCEQMKPECGQCAKFKYMDLHCKLAVITGGATGIGLATARELLCNQLYRVVLADCHCEDGRKAAENLNKEHGKHKACFINMDVRKHQDFEETLEEITRRFGGIDILVNNAGFLDDNYWKDEIDINVKAVIRGSLLGMKYLSQKRTPGSSVIVNVASTLGIDADPPYLPIFSATQHAIAGLTRSLGVGTVRPRLDGTVLVNLAERRVLHVLPISLNFRPPWLRIPFAIQSICRGHGQDVESPRHGDPTLKPHKARNIRSIHQRRGTSIGS